MQAQIYSLRHEITDSDLLMFIVQCGSVHSLYIYMPIAHIRYWLVMLKQSLRI